MTATTRFFKYLTAAIAVGMALYHMFVVWFGAPEQHIFRALHLMLALTLTFLWYRSRSLTEDEEAMLPPEQRGQYTGPSLLDLALVVVGLVAIGHIFWNYNYFINRIYYVDDLTTFDTVMAVSLILLILEATRRLMGLALPVTALLFLAYALFIARVEPMRLLDQLYMTTEGIFGMPLGVSAAYVMIFVLFGAFMERTGTGQLFMDFAMSLTGHTAGGPGKVSVVSSSLFGTISGSAVANVMVDGPISIPLMKRTGFKAHFAAAVEAVASTGGQIMPPIMGAAAFVMAEFMGVSYGQVVIWAIIPAVLYYVACFAAVHFEAKRQGLHGVPRSELPKLGKTLRDRGHLFIPVATILVVMNAGYSAPLAALAGLLACFPVALLRSTTRGNVTARAVFDALVDGAKNTLAVALACACAGIIIGIVTLTGLGITFTQFVVGLAQNYLLLALILTMLAGIVLGMGMPTTPAYIIMSALLIPALIKLGVAKPAAHMFAFYFAILSAITPPVALAVYAASGLAKSDIWKTGWSAVKVGAAGFIVPFMFVYEPALLMIGDWPTIIHASITATAGCLLLAAGLAGFLIGPANMLQRALLVIGAFALVVPGLVTDIIGAVTCGTVILWQLAERKKAQPSGV
ncbi:MAG TPA: TRAP transporter permease [Hyphomicrobiaceae bacterium]|nr:TRAP transporter permease [Hyphomicrobiaceae bacterium]